MFDKSVSLFTVSGRLITDDEIDLGQVYTPDEITVESCTNKLYRRNSDAKKTRYLAH